MLSVLKKNAVNEEEKQSQATQDIFGADEDEGSEEPGSEPSDDDDTLDGEDITVEDIIKRLNSIRSGKSFNDEDVESNMRTYFEELDAEEHVALFSFLKGISQIVTGEIDASVAAEPSDDPANIKMIRNGQQKQKTQDKSKQKEVSVKPNVLKASTASTSKEDVSAPLPIKPKQK